MEEKKSGGLGKVAGTVAKVGVGALKLIGTGLNPQSSFGSGVTHPDNLIHRRGLYIPRGPGMSPNGYRYDKNNWRELYFPKKPKGRRY